MRDAINNMRFQLNCVCYDKEMITKLSRVWDAYFELVEAFKKEAFKNSGTKKNDYFLCDFPGGCGSRLNGRCDLMEPCDQYIPHKIVKQ
jgi:hypothetical protein